MKSISRKMMSVLHRAAIAGERMFDLVRQRSVDPMTGVIEPYTGFATTDAVIIRGRVLASLRSFEASERQSRWRNIKTMASLFLTDEVADVPLECDGVGTASDEEGYFSLVVPERTDQGGWQTRRVSIVGNPSSATDIPVLVPQPNARFLVISDIDDTVLKTGAYSLALNLWTTLSGNELTRRVFADAPPFLRMLNENGRNPVFYVSSSPWNMHAFLDSVFVRQSVVRGPLFLRDLGISENQFIKGTHGEHKGAAIDTILKANEGLPVILIGDTGQHDAEVYAAAAERWPERIRCVVLRQTPRESAATSSGLEQLRAHSVPCFTTPDFMTTRDEVTSVMAGTG